MSKSILVGVALEADYVCKTKPQKKMDACVWIEEEIEKNFGWKEVTESYTFHYKGKWGWWESCRVKDAADESTNLPETIYVIVEACGIGSGTSWNAHSAYIDKERAEKVAEKYKDTPDASLWVCAVKRAPKSPT